jgi:hypothetical protein
MLLLRKIISMLTCMTVLATTLVLPPKIVESASQVSASNEDVLKLTIVNDGTSTGYDEKFVDLKLSEAGAGTFVIQPGQYLEYEIKTQGTIWGAGVVDIEFTDGSRLNGMNGFFDQEGLNAGRYSTMEEAANQWYHRKIKLPEASYGKTIARWILTSKNPIPDLVYTSYYADIHLTDGNGQVLLSGYSNGPAPFQEAIAANGLKPGPYPGLEFGYKKGTPSGDVLNYTVTNDPGSAGKYIGYIMAGAPSDNYRFQAGDIIEYDIYLPDPNSIRAGAIEVIADDETRFRNLSDWVDTKGTIGAGWGDITAYASKGWYKRQLAVPASMIGLMPVAWQVVGNNMEPGYVYTALYDNIVVKDSEGNVKVVVYEDGPPQLNYIGEWEGGMSAELKEATYVPLPVDDDEVDMDASVAPIKFEALNNGFERGNPEGNVLKLSVANNGTAGDKKAATEISAIGTDYTFAAGDVIQYDVFIPDSLAGQAGGLGVVSDDLSSFKDEPDWTDVQGLSGNPNTDITRYASGEWYRRELTVPANIVGTSPVSWQLVAENDQVNYSYDVFYDNILVKDAAGTTKLVVFEDNNQLNNVVANSGASQQLSLVNYEDTTSGPSGDVLKFVFHTQAEVDYTPMTEYSNKYTYRVFSEEEYVLQGGEYLEYDIKHTAAGLRPAVGIDLTFTDNTNARDYGLVDQNGMSMHPSTDLLRFTANGWYHRKIKIPDSLAGKTISNWLIAGEYDDGNAWVTAFVDNVKMTDGNHADKAVAYEDGYPTANADAYHNNVLFSNLSSEPLDGYAEPTPSLVNSSYSSEDIPIQTVNVLDFAAEGDGITDDTYAFQSAINAAHGAGGGVVFIPENKYAIKGSLYIPSNVTLRGEWQSPEEGGLGKGTILQVYENKGNANGFPFISINESGAVTNLSIWYPEQDVHDIQPYPWTIQTQFGDNAAIRNVTLINSYQGIKNGPNWNELQNISNVYGTVLRKGIETSFNTDVLRIENVQLESDYWIHSGLPNAPIAAEDQEALLNHLHAHAEGLLWGRVDWPFVYNVKIRDMHTAIKFMANFTAHGGGIYNAGGNAQFAKLDIDDVQVGVYANRVGPMGYGITDSIIRASIGSNPVAIQTTASFDAYLGINQSIIGGSPQTAVLLEGSGLVSIQDSTFENWNGQDGHYAVDQRSGELILTRNEFQRNEPSIRLGSGAASASIIGNVFAAAPQIVNDSNLGGDRLAIDHTDVGASKRTATEHTKRPTIPGPAKDTFINVKASPYYAVGDGVADDTVAIQSAIAAAEAAEGGIVYFPAGEYRVTGTFNVPSGVELRGIFDTPHHTSAWGSVLLVYSGKGDAEGTPFITLSANSGMRGMTIHYPEQNHVQIQPYPWTIRGNGENVYVINTSFTNAYRGIDFGYTHRVDNHYINGVLGDFLDRGVYIGQSEEGWVENVHINPHLWLNAPVKNSPMGKPGEWVETLYAQMVNNQKAFTFGACEKQHAFGLFAYATKVAFTLEAQNGVGCSGTFYLNGLDSTPLGIEAFEIGASGATFVANQFYSAGPQSERGLVRVVKDPGGKLAIINTLAGDFNSKPTFIANINGGDNLIQQINIPGVGSNTNFIVNQGKTSFESVAVRQAANDAYVGPDVSSVSWKAGMYAGGFNIDNQAGCKATWAGNVGGANVTNREECHVTPTPTPTPTPIATPTAPSATPTPTPSATPSVTPTATPAPKHQMDVSASEGAELIVDHLIKVNIPAGALVKDGKVTVSVTDTTTVDAMQMVSPVLELSYSSGHKSNGMIDLTFNYNPDQLSGHQKAAVYYYNDKQEKWIFVGGTVNGDGTVTARVNHFHKFAVFAYEPTVLADMANHWAAAYTDRLIGMKVIQGFPDGTFKPQQSVTRAQFVVMLTEALGLKTSEKTTSFSDDGGISAWAKPSIAAAARSGLIKGSPDQGRTLFKANQSITRAEMVVILANALRENGYATGSAKSDFKDAAQIPDWAQTSAEAAVSAKLINGYQDGTFRPDHTATRAEGAAMIYRLLEALHM